MRVGWHACENKMKLFIQVYSSGDGSRSISCDDSFLSRCSSLSWVEFEKACFPQVHEIHLDRRPQGDLMAAAHCQRAVRRHMNYKELSLLIHIEHALITPLHFREKYCCLITT